ncbi:MAG TPA: DNA methyltransferase, partial [Flavobacteriales bacterium]|nr:DNA methyltransferase [Flavobacteriales bacterium]
MPTTAQLRDKLIEKLQELFQLDQPELDFGFYRIMHAKAEQVQRFLENDLLAEVQQAFADGTSAKQAELKQAYEEALAQAKKFGAPDPENVDAVQEAKGRWTDALDTTKAEAEVYDHLYRFFERYYEDGDFVSRRYLTRETAGKAAPYAVPYDGQEVMLHWANRDQYYIKTSEHFDHYTFELREAARQLRQAAKASTDQEALDLDEGLLEGEPLRVHFRIVTAAEGEHNNVKESADKKRYFIVDGTEPIAFNAAGELECRFTFRPDSEKTGQENTWKQTRNSRNEAALLETITALAKTDKRAAAYLPLLKLNAARGKKKDERTLLAKYIAKYTATNSKDYFIHKDLGGFLRRELDFYLKNEVMRLDDLEGAEAPRVEQYLAKLKVIRRIAHKLTDFLAQLENFQKRLWLKKKFVVETNYCITLDRVPLALYPAIAANAAQKAEWEKLFAIADLPGYEATKPLSVDFLKANPYLVLDTAFLSEAEKTKLLAALDDLDAQCNGLLVHSENIQALRLLEARYREQVKCVYIDPPYNTEGDDFMYKDSFKRSSWSSMIEGRLEQGAKMLPLTGVMFASIGEEELDAFTFMLGGVFGGTNVLERSARVQKKGSDKGTFYNPSLDYVVTAVTDKQQLDGFSINIFDEAKFKKVEEDGARKGERYEDSKSLYQSSLDARPNQRYWIECPDGSFAIPPGRTFPEELVDGAFVKPNSDDGCYRWSYDNYLVKKDLIVLRESSESPLLNEKGEPSKWNVYTKRYLKDALAKGNTPVNLIADYPNAQGTDELTALGLPFSYPKPTGLVKHLVQIASKETDITVMDFFAGSGTTGQAIIDLNRGEGALGLGMGKRNYVLVEMGSYFDTLILPRLKSVVYSRTWKDGKPVSREGVSHCFKYIRLESYEDTLNALELRTDAEREKLLAANKGLREDYTLRYLLDVETKDSTSLLNHTAFTDPRAYTLNVKKPGSEERTTKAVDLIETFNYLLGLRVQHMAAPE